MRIVIILISVMMLSCGTNVSSNSKKGDVGPAGQAGAQKLSFSKYGISIEAPEGWRQDKDDPILLTCAKDEPAQCRPSFIMSVTPREPEINLLNYNKSVLKMLAKGDAAKDLKVSSTRGDTINSIPSVISQYTMNKIDVDIYGTATVMEISKDYVLIFISMAEDNTKGRSYENTFMTTLRSIHRM